MFFTTTSKHADPAPIILIPPDLSESIWADYPPLTRLRRRFNSLFYRLPDTGFFGLTPLQTHILICGYSRAGTTMLLAMMEYALPRARRFGREIRAWRAATYSWRNHAVLLSKLPGDLFTLHRLRNFYRPRRANLRTILMIRDPRDVLTSRYASLSPDEYFQDCRKWRLAHEYFRLYKNDPDVLVVRYEDLITSTSDIQKQIDAFTGHPSERPFADFHTATRADFESDPLNGLRPIDQNSLYRWRLPQHRDRLCQVLQILPDLPEILIELGYEKDNQWITSWQRESC